MTILFADYVQTEKQQQDERLILTYGDIVRSVLTMKLTLPGDVALSDLFSEFGFHATPKDEALSVISQGTLVHIERNPLGVIRIHRYLGRHYLDIETPFDFAFLKDTQRRGFQALLYWVAFGVFLFILTAALAALLRSLRPLKSLEKNILRFSDGHLDIQCQSDRKDEIARVANAFGQAAGNIRELVHSRQMFLRMIMHELRTPLAKGRIAAEMLPEDRQKERVIRAFEQVDRLISEFARLEQIASKNYQLHKKQWPAEELLHEAIELLPRGAERIVMEKQEGEIYGDRDLLIVAVKNLLDNALKHGIGEVSVTVSNHQLLIKNPGKPFEKPLEENLKPFSKSQSSQGLGLGLYLIQTIADMHGMELSYRYESDHHVFSLAPLSPDVKA